MTRIISILMMLMLLIPISLFVITVADDSEPLDGAETFYVCGLTTQRAYEYYLGNLTKKAQTDGNYSTRIRSVVADDTYIYIGGDTNQKVYQYWRTNLTKKAETLDYGGSIYEIVQDGEYIYVGGQIGTTPYASSNVKQYWKSNLTEKAETASYGGAIWALSIDTDYVYAGGTAIFKVFQYWKTNMTKKAETASYGGTLNGIDGIEVDDTHIYVIGASNPSNRFIKKYLKSTMAYVSQTVDQGAVIYALDIDETYVYCGVGTVNQARQFWKSNMTERARTVTYGGAVWAVTAMGDYVYAGGATTQRVRQYWKSNMTYKAQSDLYGGSIENINFAETFEEEPPANNPPVFSNENPSNGTPNMSFAFDWNILINDTEGDLMNITIVCSSGHSIGYFNASNNTFAIHLDSLSANVTYYVWVNATDGTGWTREWFTFTTMDIPPNNPPNAPTNEIPVNNSDYESVYNEYLNVTVSDPDGGTVDVSFYWSNHTLIGTDLNVPVDTNASLFLPDVLSPDWLSHNTTYQWYVNVSDGIVTTVSATWNFHTSMAWDCNEDREVDYLDISIVSFAYGTLGYLSGEIRADIIEEGAINYLDLSSLVRHYAESY
jgi:hypothetical protein